MPNPDTGPAHFQPTLTKIPQTVIGHFKRRTKSFAETCATSLSHIPVHLPGNNCHNTHTQLNYLLGVGASDLPKSIIPNSSADPGSRTGTRLQRGFNVTRQPRPTRLGGPHINFLRIVQVSFIRWFKSFSSLFFPEIEWTHSLQGYS